MGNSNYENFVGYKDAALSTSLDLSTQQIFNESRKGIPVSMETRFPLFVSYRLSVPWFMLGAESFFRQSRVIANELPRRKQRDLWDRRHAWQEAQTRFRYRQGRAIELVAHLERRLPAAA